MVIVAVLVAVNAVQKTTTMSTKHEYKGWAEALAWNTGSPYTIAGQRIAAAAIDGGVWFVDVDRGIHGWMPTCTLSEVGVMGRYNRGEYRSVPPPVYDLNVRQFQLSAYKDGTVTRVIGLYAAFRAALEKMAKAVPTVVSESAPKGWESVEGGAK